MCFFDCVLVLYFRCYCALFLKLRLICSSYASSQLLFHVDFLFLFCDYEEMITSPEFIFLLHSSGLCALKSPSRIIGAGSCSRRSLISSSVTWCVGGKYVEHKVIPYKTYNFFCKFITKNHMFL